LNLDGVMYLCKVVAMCIEILVLGAELTLPPDNAMKNGTHPFRVDMC
jgi:hypothetical protein